jgi:LmbE family N-acetylglucosaminyl deacetylase
MEPNRVLAVAAATGRIGMVFLIGNRLMDWQISGKAAKSPEQATRFADAIIRSHRPDVFITEKIDVARNKGDHSKALIVSMAATAAEYELLDISVERPHDFPNKYAEAAMLIERYPEIAAWQPTRRFFDNEPRNTVLFEALALANAALKE